MLSRGRFRRCQRRWPSGSARRRVWRRRHLLFERRAWEVCQRDSNRRNGPSKFGSMTMALADVDGNGTLDLYVVNNRTDDIRDQGHVDIQMVRGKLTIPP